MEVNQIIQGDTKTELKKLPNDLVDTIVTSPPYWGLRDYGTANWEGGDKNCDHNTFKGKERPDLPNPPASWSTRDATPTIGDCPKCGAKRIDLQIGLEPTLEEYITKLLAVTQELQRVLKPSGVMFFNHGDCYGGSRGTGSDIEEHWQKGKQTSATPGRGLGIPKCLALQNYRLILRMIDEQGWILRNTIIWNKPNHMPSSVKDRFANSYEPVFMLVKQQKYWFDLDAVRQPHSFNRWSMSNKIGSAKAEQAAPGQTQHSWQRKGHSGYYDSEGNLLVHPAGKNPGDLWTIPTQPFPEAHFATFPEKLIEPMIMAGCPEWICNKCGKARERIIDFPEGYLRGGWNEEGAGLEKGHRKVGESKVYSGKTLGWTDCKCKAGWRGGIVLDPFAGAATTCVVAKSLGRQWLGIELSPDYIKIAEKRLLNTHGRLL